MSCCSSSSITPCTISVNDALSLLDCTCNSCGSLCDSSVGTPMAPSPIPQFASFITVKDYNVLEGVFSILNFEASGASFSTVTDDGGGQCTINVDTQLVEKILYQDAVNLLSNSDLIPGKLYWIYDVGDALTVANGGLNTSVTAANAYAGIVLKALDVDKFDTNGAYIARTPDRTKSKYFYNDIAGYVINSYVEHFNFIYTNSGGPLTGPFVVPPSADSTNWTLLTKDDSRYVTDVYSCVYDILNDQILSITDNANNTLTVSNTVGKSNNDLFLYCFRWGAGNVFYGNKITVNGLTSTYKGFLAGSGNYPKIASHLLSTSVNFNFTDFLFYGNKIQIDIGKGALVFNSIRYTGVAPNNNYVSFYGDPLATDIPEFSNNTIFNSIVYINRNIIASNNTVNESTLGTINVGIIDPSIYGPLGSLMDNNITRCRIRSTNISINSGKIDLCNISECTIEENVDTEIFDIRGSVDIYANESCNIRYVHGINRSAPASATTFKCENKIYDNVNVLIESVSGDRFDINENENISVRHNVRLYQGNIARNTAPLTPIILDTKGTSIITTADNREACSIIQCELDNFSTISDCTWETAGAISRTKLSRSEIKFLTIDFRDPVWAGTGIGPTNPPAASDMLIDTVNVYLFQNRNKLANNLYPCPAIFNGLTATASIDIDGNPAPAGGPSIYPALNAYTYDAVGNEYENLPIICNDTPYCTGAVLSNVSSDAYVFLNTEIGGIYNGATKTLSIPNWAQHATVIYLYNKSPFTVNIAKINDYATANRPNFKIRLVALSDGLVINLDTVAIAGATTSEIVASVTPGIASIGVTDKFDILELEKRGDIYYVSNYQKMQ